MYPQFNCFEQNYEKHHNVSSENYHFYSCENCSILHGHVLVMSKSKMQLFWLIKQFENDLVNNQ